MRSDGATGRAKPEVTIRARTRFAAALNALPLPRGRIDTGDTVLIAGTPRSGTTWLGQVLGAAEGFSLVNEPMGLKMPGVERAGFTWATWREPDEEWPQGEAVLRRYFTGRGMTVKLLMRNRLHAFRDAGLIIKEVKANRLLPWIARRFHLRGMIHIIRHPCAVVASQMENFPDRDPCVPDNLRYLERRRPELLDWAAGLATEWEERALTWALDQLVPLRVPQPRPWLTVHYENLVLDGERELARIVTALRLTMTPAIRGALGENSWQVRDGSVNHERAAVEDRLRAWRKRLSPEQVRDVLAVCERCGVALYGPDDLPLGA